MVLDIDPRCFFLGLVLDDDQIRAEFEAMTASLRPARRSEGTDTKPPGPDAHPSRPHLRRRPSELVRRPPGRERGPP